MRRWHILAQWVNQRGWTRGAEIGVKEGRTFLYLLSHCPHLMLLGVDLFEARPGLEAEGGESNCEANLPQHEARLRATLTQFGERGCLLKGESTQIAQRVPDEFLDFVFIDADHREPAVRADIAAWLPKIKLGGTLCGHDAQPKFPGVIKTINDLCPGWVQHPDSVWEWPKNKI